jgi:hypothetical protein
MGSKLKLDTEEIWPPSVGEVLSGHYGRIAKLMDVHAIPTDILYQYTSFYQVYGPVINDINAIVNQQGGMRPDFWYDWRIDLAKPADLLAQTIAKACSGPNPADQVSIVSHSMGGLVSRYFWRAENTMRSLGSRTSSGSSLSVFRKSARR